MPRKFKIYVGEVLGEPKILVECSFPKCKGDLRKKIEASAKAAKELTVILHAHIWPKFETLLEEKGIVTGDFSDYARDYVTIASKQELWWGDKEKKHIIYAPEADPLRVVLGGDVSDNHPTLFMNVERWY